MLPVPPHFDPDAVGEVWRVSYEDRALDAEAWAVEHELRLLCNIFAKRTAEIDLDFDQALAFGIDRINEGFHGGEIAHRQV